MFQKLKNLIDRYSWFVFIMMILVLFLNYIYPFDPSFFERTTVGMADHDASFSWIRYRMCHGCYYF